MMAIMERLAELGALLTYPVEGYGGQLTDAAVRVRDLVPDAASALTAFECRIRDTPVEGLQEAFTQTFDLNPVCALEVGWQLYGEEYERGAFLVRMREILRDHSISEGGELPDHLSLLLALLPRLGISEARDFASGVLVPAVDKMVAAIEKSESPFQPLMQAIAAMLAMCTASNAELSHA